MEYSGKISESANDGEEINGGSSEVKLAEKTSSMSTTNAIEKCGYWAARFTNVTVPNHAVLVEAVFEVYCSAKTEGVGVAVNYENTGNSAALKAEAKNISNRAESKITGEWTGFTTAAYNKLNVTVELAHLFQIESWAYGNALTIIMKPLSTKALGVENYDGSAEKAAKLNIIWKPAPPVIFSQAVQISAVR